MALTITILKRQELMSPQSKTLILVTMSISDGSDESNDESIKTQADVMDVKDAFTQVSVGSMTLKKPAAVKGYCYPCSPPPFKSRYPNNGCLPCKFNNK